MKPKSLILISAAIIISNFTPFKTSYSQTSGPMASTVYSLAFSGSNILAGTESGIFKSSDSGKTWLQTLLYNQIAQSICSNGKVVIAGISFGGMYVSNDDGMSWERLPEQKNFFRWNRITSVGSIFFTGTTKGVFKSEDNGQSWIRTALDSEGVYLIHSNGSTLFAGTVRVKNSPFGIYISNDNGRNWDNLFDFESIVKTIAVSKSDIYVSTEKSGIFRSTNWGENWEKLAFEPICSALCSVGSNIIAGTYDGMYVSTDNGESWKCTLANKSIISIVANNSYVFCGTWKSGLYISTNEGMNWSETPLIKLEIKPELFKKEEIIGHWDDYIISPLMGGNLVILTFMADSFYYRNMRYSDVFEEPCSLYVGEEFASGEFTVDNHFIYLSGYWTDNKFKKVLTEAPCNSGRFEFKYEYKYYSNHMLHLKLVEPTLLPSTGVKAELYLYKK